MTTHFHSFDNAKDYLSEITERLIVLVQFAQLEHRKAR